MFDLTYFGAIHIKLKILFVIVKLFMLFLKNIKAISNQLISKTDFKQLIWRCCLNFFPY